MAYMISLSAAKSIICLKMLGLYSTQGCISCGTCSYLELTEDHVLTSAYVKIFRIVTRNAVNKSFWRKKDCSWPPLNKYAMNIWLSSLKIRAHLSWRTGKHLHVLHVLRTYSTCSYPGYQDTTTYAALVEKGKFNEFPWTVFSTFHVGVQPTLPRSSHSALSWGISRGMPDREAFNSVRE